MTEPISDIARALLGDSDEPDRQITCCICGAMTTCLGFIWHSVKLWNQREAELATEENRRADFIRPSQMGIACPGDCTQRKAIEMRIAVQQEINTTSAYLGMLHAGKYNPESLAWLRKHGHSKLVTRVLAKEGTTKAHE